jgi:hypothetical protein
MIDERMRQANPERWSGRTAIGCPVGSVVLNPKRAPSVRQTILTLTGLLADDSRRDASAGMEFCITQATCTMAPSSNVLSKNAFSQMRAPADASPPAIKAIFFDFDACSRWTKRAH